MQGYRTYLSILISLMATVASAMGYEIDQECLNNTAVTIGGLLAAVWFRYRARRPK